MQRPLEVWDICPNILGGLFCESPCIKKWKAIVSVVENILLTKIQVSDKLNKIDWFSYQTVLFVARKNWLLYKIKNSTILINLK